MADTQILRLTVEVTCSFGHAQYVSSIAMPEGWTLTYDTVYEDKGFCPDHALIAEWTETQCRGCVGGWMDCGLWDDFTYKTLKLSDADCHDDYVGGGK